MVALAVTRPPLRGLRQGSAQWLRPGLRVRVKHLKAKGVLRHATVKHSSATKYGGRRRRQQDTYGSDDMADMSTIEMQDRELFAAMAMQALITRGQRT
jgi:hypothetical protein